MTIEGQNTPVSTPSGPSAGLEGQDATQETQDATEAAQGRVERYAAAIRRGYHSPITEWVDYAGAAVIAVADQEQAEKDATIAELRAAVERLTVDHEQEFQVSLIRRARAEAAEARVAVLEATVAELRELADIFDDSGVTWRCSACGWIADESSISSALWHEADRVVAMVCPECSEEGRFVDHEPAVEKVAAKVHEAWMQAKRAQGVTSRPSEWGEEQMVDYADLSEPAKDLDRATVKAVFDALRAILDAPKDTTAP